MFLKSTVVWPKMEVSPCHYYKHKDPCPRDMSFTGLSAEEYRPMLSTDILEEFKEMNKGGRLWKKLQEKFAPSNPKEKRRHGLSRYVAHAPERGVF
uniref:Mitochondrial nucleoid factor 1 n=1 Tax=Ailuropoda melanoleuca TaxID=9646 RepID=A0A7N5JML3_AILME